MGALKSCGYCCAGFSLFAIGFLFVVGAILKSGSDVINIDPASKDQAGTNCYVAAAIYAGFLALSIVCIMVPSNAGKGGEELHRLRQVNQSGQ